jgi:hypothetical protein
MRADVDACSMSFYRDNTASLFYDYAQDIGKATFTDADIESYRRHIAYSLMFAESPACFQQYSGARKH